MIDISSAYIYFKPLRDQRVVGEIFMQNHGTPFRPSQFKPDAFQRKPFFPLRFRTPVVLFLR